MEKLKSRKLWMSVAGLVAMMIILFGGDYEVATQVSAIIVAGGCIIAYVLGEAWCDSKKIYPSKKLDESWQKEDKA